MNQPKSGTVKSRREKRAGAKAARRTKKRSTEETVRVLTLRVAALEGGLKKLQEVINDNAQRTGHGLFIGDNHMWVHGAMIADLASGQLKINENGEADFPYYYGKRQEFLQRMVAEQEAKKKPAEQKPGEPEEFGGDYGSSEERSEEPEGQQGEGGAEDVGDGEPEAPAVPEVPQAGVAQQEQPG